MKTADPNVVTASRTIGAPADVIFEILADPRRHQEFDGSGMLRGTDAAGPVTGIGDEFVMRMYFERMGDYQMRNTIVEFEPSRRIAWSPTMADRDAPGWERRWGYALEPDGSGTKVTEFLDFNDAAPEARQSLLKGRPLAADAMKASLERLGTLAESA
jgi:uncharacterized protein YndB with AHSA1/START domain